jgi:hypothetical protein
VLRLSRGPRSLFSLLWPELPGRVIQEHKRRAPELLALPVLKPAQLARAARARTRLGKPSLRQNAAPRPCIELERCQRRSNSDPLGAGWSEPLRLDRSTLLNWTGSWGIAGWSARRAALLATPCNAWWSCRADRPRVQKPALTRELRCYVAGPTRANRSRVHAS